MKREVLQKMLQWKNDPERKPLILKGARQVGKTWLPCLIIGITFMVIAIPLHMMPWRMHMLASLSPRFSYLSAHSPTPAFSPL